jgi:formylglycine-generating enzyme required for sulfatase activity
MRWRWAGLLVAVLASWAEGLAADERARWPDLTSPPSKGGGERDAALIAAVERYVFVAPIPGARANGEAWFEYLTRGRGVPVERATLLRDHQVTIDKLRKLAVQTGSAALEGGTIWFVFIGHGVPSKDGRGGRLVGADVQQEVDSLYERSAPYEEILGLLRKGAAARVVAVLDTCFSGRAASGEPLVKGLQPLIVEDRPPSGGPGTVVLTAARQDELAGPLPGASRPAFSYLVLGAMRGWADADGDGSVTAGEVHDYTTRVLRAVVKDRTQSPTILGPGGAVLAAASEKGPDVAALVLRYGAGTRAPSHMCPPEMAALPGGELALGDRGDRVTIRAFCMDLTEVTVKAYAQCVRSGQCSERAGTVDWPGITDAEREKHSAFCNRPRAERHDHPANCVTWDQAATYCLAQGKRLPSEEEWEWAARGGPEARLYPWGNDPPEAQLCWRRLDGTCPVGRFPRGATAQGLHDLAGNVWEWVSSPWRAGHPGRVVRGGSWSTLDTAQNVRAADRSMVLPASRTDVVGFRCAAGPRSR